jgi:hypothetical protein
MEKATRTLAVVMQRRNARSRWAGVIWQPTGVLESDEQGAARLLDKQDDQEQWLHPGFEVSIFRDEIEGYYLNVSSDSPRVFVLWRMDGEHGDDSAPALPLQVTASYDEAGRWMDGGHSVDSVPMPPDMFAWLRDYVEKNYKPEPKKRRKPRSFIHPKDRVG